MASWGAAWLLGVGIAWLLGGAGHTRVHALSAIKNNSKPQATRPQLASGHKASVWPLAP